MGASYPFLEIRNYCESNVHLSSYTGFSVQLRTIRSWMDTVVDNLPNAKRIVSIILCRWAETDIIAYDKYLHKWFPTEQSKVRIDK